MTSPDLVGKTEKEKPLTDEYLLYVRVDGIQNIIWVLLSETVVLDPKDYYGHGPTVQTNIRLTILR